MNKKFLSVVFLFSLSQIIFSQNASRSKIEKFIKGNIQDKTAAVREASGNEAVWLCDKAISFALESRELLGSDRELDGLAVAAVLSFPQEYIKNASDTAKEIILKELISIFESFDSSPNVRITVISKLNALSNDLNLTSFIKTLNKMLSENSLNELDSSVVKSSLNFLSVHGDNESFIITYNLWNSRRFSSFNTELENAIVMLIPVSLNEAVVVANSPNMEKVMGFFNLINSNKSKINENYFSELAENVLSNSIFIVKKNQKTVSSVTDMQIECVQILGEYNWTKASAVVLEFFDLARVLYSHKDLKEDDLIKVIHSLKNCAPLDAVPALIDYLEFLNSRVEKFEAVSENVALAVIKTLGAIGDKSAFDSLLGVTYYAYPQTVLAAAREALSNLRW